MGLISLTIGLLPLSLGMLEGNCRRALTCWFTCVLLASLCVEVLPQARVICEGNRIITNIMYRARDTWAPRIAVNYTPLYLKDALDILFIILKNARFYNASNVYLEGEVGENSLLPHILPAYSRFSYYFIDGLRPQCFCRFTPQRSTARTASSFSLRSTSVSCTRPSFLTIISRCTPVR